MLLALLVCFSQPIYAQNEKAKQRPLLGWDLTYSSLLRRNNIARDEWMWKWLGRDYRSPVKRLIENWKDEPIISSILIETPAFHGGEHVTEWYVRTGAHAYYWSFLDGKPHIHVKEMVSPESYDRLASQISTWQQAEPLKPERTPVGLVPGYFGFLSFYNHEDSRQILLSLEDFIICETKDCESREEGRLTVSMKSLEAKNPK
jgi:hypothetical protein